MNSINSILLTKEADEDFEDSEAPKSFQERALSMMKKTQEGLHSHLVNRKLTNEDWLYIHKVIRKSKGLK